MGQHHGFLWWILIGLIAGGLAKAIAPGDNREPQGCLTTMLLGIVGSVLFGWIMRTIFHSGGSGTFVGTLVGATIGAILVIALARKFRL